MILILLYISSASRLRPGIFYLDSYITPVRFLSNQFLVY